MSQSGNWGDHMMIFCLSRALQRSIHVISSKGKEYDVTISNGPLSKAIVIGHLVELHYVSLRPRKFITFEIPTE